MEKNKMKLVELVELGYDQRVVLKSTMNRVDTSTEVYSVPDAIHHYLKLKTVNKKYKEASKFLKDLVEYDG
jgi:hypothetical protein